MKEASQTARLTGSSKSAEVRFRAFVRSMTATRGSEARRQSI